MHTAIVSLALCLLAADGHLDANSVYRELLDAGVTLAEGVVVELPAPTMRDGLDRQAQEQVLAEVAGVAYPVAQLTRKSVVAPQILRLEELTHPAAPGRRVDVYFVAYGDLERMTSREFLDRLWGSESQDEDVAAEGQSLAGEELVERGLELAPADQEYERWAHGSYTLLKRVEVHGTLHSRWSRTADSLVVAARLDPRFEADAEFPNLWRPLVRSNEGQVTLGPAEPYRGMAMYMKLTPLAEPAGAVFVEAHLVFGEPHGWFDGANLLGSKLPAIVQSRVRALRRELLTTAE